MPPHITIPAASPTSALDAPSCVDTSVIETSMQYVDDTKNSVDKQSQDRDDEVASVASTTRYEHEPFETFQHKVAEFATEHFHRNPRDISIHQMKGGANNRVVGIKIASKPKKFSLHWFLCRCFGARKKTSATRFDSYIIRIPRVEFSDDSRVEDMAESMKRELAILKTVSSWVPLPVPKVFSYDLSTENICERPYMIQTRLPGRNLRLELWHQLNMQQKQCVAKCVTGLAAAVASVEGPAGDISPENLSRPSSSPICVDTFSTPAYDDQPTCKPALARNPIDHLLEQCERWRACEKATAWCFEEIWDGFAAISRALEKRGFLHGPCVLVHGDLMPYNLLAEVCNETDVNVTGVIDWDLAVIAPEFMAYKAPFWLWTPEDMDSDNEDDENMANLEPIEEEGKILKQVFLENASEKYKFYAFAPEAMLARRMFYILKNGHPGDWEFEEAKSVIREWNELHPEDGVQSVLSVTDSESDEDQDENE
ncbi:hypothetical protein AG0111_0g5510 [Alternaria gaisen]|uniref:Uncharacterized protein n=1 Tax=Alternaria gaisen TaxID=167740 RepID=A0ACB6FPR8_9PLEO|nr:hypothetical protein AG0111_0g5510 [Alternaria gaisen]